MEFREYWRIIWRHRMLILPLAAVTFLASLLFNLVLPPSYRTDTTVYVQANIPPPPPNANPYYSEEYYRTVYSEYLTDDLSVILKGGEFARMVAERIEQRYGHPMGIKDVVDSVAATKKVHRTLKITIATGSESLTRKIGEAVDEVLRLEGPKLLTRGAGEQPFFIQVVDPPREVTSQSLLRRLLNVLLHTAVAVVVGVGLAFFLHFLDDRIRDEEDAAHTLNWPVLAAIPSEEPQRNSLLAPSGTLASLLPADWRRRPAS